MADLRLIMNGDDLGRTTTINEAIMRAHEQGVLTSASLMVTGEAADQAARLARAYPSLAVGLHMVLLNARTALPAAEVPHLVDGRGWLSRDPFLAGVRCFFSPTVRGEVRREIAAQFERFLGTGLPLAHVDGHYLMHLHPAVFSILIPLAERYQAPGIRLPRDDLRRTLAMDLAGAAGKVGWAAVYALLCGLALRRLRRGQIAYTDRVYGLLESGRMHERFVTGLVRGIPAAVRSAELYFHPCTQSLGEPYGPNPGDLAALLSPQVRRAIDERGAQLTTYAALGAGARRRAMWPGSSSS